MASLSWTWKDYWNWFRQIELEADKAHAMKELLGNGWLKNLSAEIQAEVMVDAPMEILKSLKYFPDVIKTDAIILIEYMLKTKDEKWRRKRK